MIRASLVEGDRTEGHVTGSIVGDDAVSGERAVGGADGEAEVTSIERRRRNAVLGGLDHLGGGQGFDGGGLSLIGVLEGHVVRHLHVSDKLTLVVVSHRDGDLLLTRGNSGDAAGQAAGVLRNLVGVDARLGEGDIAEGDAAISRVGDGGLLGQRSIVVARCLDLETELAGLQIAAFEHLREVEVGSAIDGDGVSLVGVLEHARSAVGVGSAGHELAGLLRNRDGHDRGVRIVGVAGWSSALLGYVERIGAGSLEGHSAEGEGLGLAVPSTRDGSGVRTLSDNYLVAIVLGGSKLEVERRGHVVAGQGLGALDGGIALEGHRPGLVRVSHGEGAGTGDSVAVGGVVLVNSVLNHGPRNVAHAGRDDNVLGPVVGCGQLESIAVVLAVLLQLDGDGSGKSGTVGVLPLLLHGHSVYGNLDGRLLVAVRLLIGNLVVLAGLLNHGLVIDLGAVGIVGGKLSQRASLHGSIVRGLVRLDLEGHRVSGTIGELTLRREIPRDRIAVHGCLGGFSPSGAVLLVGDVNDLAVLAQTVNILRELVDDLHVLVGRGLLDGLSNLLKGLLEALLRRAVEIGALRVVCEALHLGGRFVGADYEHADGGTALVGLVLGGTVVPTVAIGGAFAVDAFAPVIVPRPIIVLAVAVRGVAIREEYDVLLDAIAARGKAVRDREATFPVRSLVVLGPRRHAVVNGVRARGPVLDRLRMSAERDHGHLDLLVLRQLRVGVGQKGVRQDLGGVLRSLHLGGPAVSADAFVHRAGNVYDNHDVDGLSGLGLLGSALDIERQIIGAVVIGLNGFVMHGSLIGDVRISRGRRKGCHAKQRAKRHGDYCNPPPHLFSDSTEQSHATTPCLYCIYAAFIEPDRLCHSSPL